MVKEPGSKKVHRPTYGLKIVHGSPVPQITIFGETERLVRTSFDVSVCAPYHAMWFSEIMNLTGKKSRVVFHFLLREYPGKR